MRIKYISYYDKALEWKLETTFSPNLTLLVGVSGVGKTQILDAIWRLKNIAGGMSAKGIEWKIEFITSDGDKYCWSGEFENTSIPERENNIPLWPLDEENDNQQRILSEELSLNGQVIVQRNAADIFFKGEKTPKLSPVESVLSILNQEEDIAPAYHNFKRIIRSDFSDYRSHKIFWRISDFLKMAQSQHTLEQIQEINLDSRLKIVLLQSVVPEVFKSIKDRFIDMFPQVEDVRFDFYTNPQFQTYPFEDVQFDFYTNPQFQTYPFLRIKEKGVKNWIRQDNISSGMYKTFMHISEMFLWPEGTVVLIDEFENSLGVNCIDVLTENLIQENSKLQFILTSHHPYIINNISPQYWKVVTRKGGVVSTHDAKDLQIGDSSHKAFIQLINLDEFKEGIMVS